MRDRHFILKNRELVPCDLMTWAMWYDSPERIVARDELAGDVSISTVFLGLDHQWGDGPPLLFETMIFGGPHDGYQERCSTWDEAEAQHKVAVTRASEPPAASEGVNPPPASDDAPPQEEPQ